MIKGVQVVKGFATFVLFVLSFSISTGFAQDPCDSYTTYAYAEELAEDVITEEINYWSPLEFTAIVTNCHHDVYSGVTQLFVFTDWFAYNGEDYFYTTLTLTFRDEGVYWNIADANPAVWEHINSTDVTLDFLELLLAAASE